MSHNSRLAVDALYVDGLPPPGLGNWWKGIDVAQAASINGRTGGTSTPSGTIFIGGAGMRFDAAVTMSGGATVVNGFGSGARVLFDKSVPQFSPQRTRSIVTSCGRFIDLHGSSVTTFSAIHYNTLANAYYSNVDDCVYSVRPGMHILVPLRVHNGAQFSVGVVNLKVVSGHASVPEQLPRARVISVDAQANVTPVQVTGQASGWNSVPTPANVAAWNGSSPTIGLSFIIPTVIDTSRFRYYVEIYDENGPSALGGNTYFSVDLSLHNIGDLRFQ